MLDCLGVSGSLCEDEVKGEYGEEKGKGQTERWEALQNGIGERGVTCVGIQVWKESIELLSDTVEGSSRLVPHDEPSPPII